MSGKVRRDGGQRSFKCLEQVPQRDGLRWPGELIPTAVAANRPHQPRRVERFQNRFEVLRRDVLAFGEFARWDRALRWSRGELGQCSGGVTCLGGELHVRSYPIELIPNVRNSPRLSIKDLPENGDTDPRRGRGELLISASGRIADLLLRSSHRPRLGVSNRTVERSYFTADCPASAGSRTVSSRRLGRGPVRSRHRLAWAVFLDGLAPDSPRSPLSPPSLRFARSRRRHERKSFCPTQI